MSQSQQKSQPQSQSQPQSTMSIGELALRTGSKVETIRYYERAGLMSDPPRTFGGHRIYDEAHYKRLSFICRGRALGFPMAEIKSMLGMMDTNTQSCSEVAAATSLHLSSVRERIYDLQCLERALSNTLAKCRRGDDPECAILDALSSGYEDG